MQSEHLHEIDLFEVFCHSETSGRDMVSQNGSKIIWFQGDAVTTGTGSLHLFLYCTCTVPIKSFPSELIIKAPWGNYVISEIGQYVKT